MIALGNTADSPTREPHTGVYWIVGGKKSLMSSESKFDLVLSHSKQAKKDAKEALHPL